jgi:hypothetical protein
MTERGLHQLIRADTTPEAFERLLETHVDIYWTYLYGGDGGDGRASSEDGRPRDDAAPSSAPAEPR